MLKKIGTYQDVDIMYNAHDEMVNLNQMWNAAGKVKIKHPYEWLRQEDTADLFIAQYHNGAYSKCRLSRDLEKNDCNAENSKCGLSPSLEKGDCNAENSKCGCHPSLEFPAKPEEYSPDFNHAMREWTTAVMNIARDIGVVQTQRGKYGGTWAHRSLALEYGAYLNAELRALILKVFEERVEEEVNPELGIKRSRQRAIDAWRRQGHDDKWIAARLKTMDERNSFTDTLQAHGVEGKGYADCTNAIYKGIVDKTGSEIKAQRGIQKGSPARDGLELHELISVEFAEMLSEKRIEDNNAQGNGECKRECGTASRSVRALLDNTTG